MPLDAKTFRPTPHGRVYECSSCGLGFVHPRPTATETKAFYELEAYYTQGASHMVATPPPGLLSRIRTHLAWRVDHGESMIDVMDKALARSGEVLDIGCGSGRLLKDLAARGHRAIGVERDAATVALDDPHITVLEGSAEALPPSLEPGRFDAVAFAHVLEHLVDPVAAVRSAAALLKRDGLLFCEVPNNEALIAKRSGLAWEHLDIPRHINFFTKRSLATLIGNAGLSVRRIYFRGYCRYFSDSYIATEQRIFDRLAADGGRPPRTIRNSGAAAWRLLAQTAFGRPPVKYDSVGIVAQRM